MFKAIQQVAGEQLRQGAIRAVAAADDLAIAQQGADQQVAALADGAGQRRPAAQEEGADERAQRPAGRRMADPAGRLQRAPGGTGAEVRAILLYW